MKAWWIGDDTTFCFVIVKNETKKKKEEEVVEGRAGAGGGRHCYQVGEAGKPEKGGRTTKRTTKTRTTSRNLQNLFRNKVLLWASPRAH